MKTKKGLWSFSPSALYKYTECQSCFWVDNNYKKQPGLPWLLNSAMDSILKHRYDSYRKNETFPPEVVKALEAEGIKPFMDVDRLNIWRESMTPLTVTDEAAGYQLHGKIDDLMLEADGRLVPADYKSSGNAPAEDKQKYYRDQLAAYGFMFAQHGHKVSNRAFLLHYFPVDKTNPSIEVKFDGHVDEVKIDIKALEQKLKDMVKLLNGPYPGHNPECQHCSYYTGRNDYAR